MDAIRFLPLGYQQLTSIDSATPLTVPAGATMAVLSAEAEIVRWRDDGVAPTAGVGMLLVAGAAPYEYTGTLAAVSVIATTSGAILNVSYYREEG